MNTRKTTALVLAATSLTFGLTACGSSGTQRAHAIEFLEKQGYQDIRAIDEGLAPPLGEGTLYFTTRVGKCKDIEVGIRPGQDVVLFSNLSPAKIDAFNQAAPGKENLAVAIFSACKATVG